MVISLIKSLFSAALGGETITFIDLDYSKESKKNENKSDISTLELTDIEFNTPSLNIEQASRPEIPLIGLGGAGLRLLDKVVSRIKSYNMDYPTLGIDIDSKDLDKYNEITNKFLVPGSGLGTGHQYTLAKELAKDTKEQLQEQIRQYFDDLNMRHKHEIVFLLLGSGGTGVGLGIEIAKLLIEMGKRPVPFMILPAKEEMTRIKFTAAAGLYYFSLAPRDRCLNLTTICIDNERILENNSKKHYSSVISSSNERIAATLGDIIATTELESHAYSADLNEFLEIFRDIKSIGVLQYLQIKNPSNTVGKLFEKVVENTTSIECDLLTATRGYFYISSNPGALIAEDYRNLLQQFNNADVFNKLYETKFDDDSIAIRGIFTGLTVTSNIEKLMQLAEDVRVDVLNKEIDQSSTGKHNYKIDRLQDGEEIDVKTGQELRDENQETFAKMQREGANK